MTARVELGYDPGAAGSWLAASLSGGPEALVLRAEAVASLRARWLVSTDIDAGLTGGIDF